MKKLLLGSTLVILMGSALAADVGVSVSIGQPGFYGRIDIGNVPQPQIIYTSPMVIQPYPSGVMRQPIYLRVPPGHEKNWAKHCHQYNACNQPVYFVQQNWYRDVYAPNYRNAYGDEDRHHGERERNFQGPGQSEGRGQGQGHGHGKNKKFRDD